ncbi:glutamate-1-semialdehyde 2,1-aminomutase [Halorarius litoreus]|uniref:glutamate-1-semialdehyde 2,1-aminomutase n=1 Tax=Halorarius litoreus TaxID=2962676 RepID=UPI0020CD1E60|nr:glutamate-1-semialdehyde 2,1-aminomutase [Halorarius litoreus]
MTHERTRELYDRALSVLPGGVNSAVRAAPQPYPLFVEKGIGGHVVDADGTRYVDWIQGLGPLLLGHDLPESVTAAIQRRTAEGPLFGMPTELEVDHAEFVARHVPSVEMLRFVNSGTEATVSAVRLARAVTGRNKVVVMQGGYHGAQESTLVEGDADHPKPSTNGIPQSFAKHTLPVPFNDAEAAKHVFEEHGDDIACVLVEPVQANAGIAYPVDGYHETVRELCDDHGSLLVWDEVITGFRVGGLQCAQGKFGIDPDLTTFGKIIGGGFPVGAIGGKTEYVEQFTPSGDTFQAGTFSGHPVTMAAGLETLQFAAENDVYEHVNDLGRQLREGLCDIVADQAPGYTVVGTDSIFKLMFTRADSPPQGDSCSNGCRQDASCARFDECPKRGTDVGRMETDRYARLFRPAMREQGILVSQNQYEANFVSYGHTKDDVERTLEAYRDCL